MDGAPPFPVIVVLAGLDTAGRGETANLLNKWMDPRWIVTQAWGQPSDEERERLPFWRYWRSLPPKGWLGMFLAADRTMASAAGDSGQTGRGEAT